MGENTDRSVNTAFAGSRLCGPLNELEATVAVPAVEVECENVSDIETLLIDIVTDQAGTLDVERYAAEDFSKQLASATQQVVASPGGVYDVPELGCLMAKVIFTNTAGVETDGLIISVRGQG